jgi:hypothetical protein
LDAIALVWIACAISFTLGWFAHAQMLKAKKRSSLPDRPDIRKQVDLTTVESVEKAHHKRAG